MLYFTSPWYFLTTNLYFPFTFFTPVPQASSHVATTSLFSGSMSLNPLHVFIYLKQIIYLLQIARFSLDVPKRNLPVTFWTQYTSLCPFPTTSSSPASSALKRSISFMTLWTARDAFTLTLTFTDELKNNLYFLSEAQRLNFNGFRILIRTFIWSYANFKLNLKGKNELTTKQLKSTKKYFKKLLIFYPEIII